MLTASGNQVISKIGMQDTAVRRHPHDCHACPSRLEGIFCELTADLVDGLNQAKTTNHYKRGQVLFYEGNPPKGLFCVYGGKVKLFKTGDDGKEVILKLACDGDIIGFRSILTENAYSLTAEVIEDAEICFVEKSFFTRLIEKDAHLAFKIIQRLGSELRTAELQLSDLLNKPVRQRLCQLLISLQKAYGKKDREGIRLDIRLTRAELASMVGATTETVIRLLSDFQSTGYVHLDGKVIIIKNINDLMDEAQVPAS